MTRYYFDVFDGELLAEDQTGLDLTNDDEAAENAIRALRDMVQDELTNGDERDFWVKVRGGDGEHFFTADLKFKSDWLKRR